MPGNHDFRKLPKLTRLDMSGSRGVLYQLPPSLQSLHPTLATFGMHRRTPSGLSGWTLPNLEHFYCYGFDDLHEMITYGHPANVRYVTDTNEPSFGPTWKTLKSLSISPFPRSDPFRDDFESPWLKDLEVLSLRQLHTVTDETALTIAANS